MRVPEAVPSVTQGSAPVASSVRVKNSCDPAASIAPAPDAMRVANNPAPVVVPSVAQRSTVLVPMPVGVSTVNATRLPTVKGAEMLAPGAAASYMTSAGAEPSDLHNRLRVGSSSGVAKYKAPPETTGPNNSPNRDTADSVSIACVPPTVPFELHSLRAPCASTAVKNRRLLSATTVQGSELFWKPGPRSTATCVPARVPSVFHSSHPVEEATAGK